MSPETQARIAVLIAAVHGREVTWGVDDCAPFAADVVKALNGRDVLGNELRGAWSTEDEAHSFMPIGLGVAVARRMRAIGWQKVDPMSAPLGAFALARREVSFMATIGGKQRAVAEARHTCAACVAAGEWFVCRSEKGVTFLRSGAIVSCWGPPDGS